MEIERTHILDGDGIVGFPVHKSAVPTLQCGYGIPDIPTLPAFPTLFELVVVDFRLRFFHYGWQLFNDFNSNAVHIFGLRIDILCRGGKGRKCQCRKKQGKIFYHMYKKY